MKAAAPRVPVLDGAAISWKSGRKLYRWDFKSDPRIKETNKQTLINEGLENKLHFKRKKLFVRNLNPVESHRANNPDTKDTLLGAISWPATFENVIYSSILQLRLRKKSRCIFMKTLYKFISLKFIYSLVAQILADLY